MEICIKTINAILGGKNMNIEKIFFKTEDKADLVGLLHKGKKTNKVVISIHGMTSDCLKKRDDIIAKTMTDNNIDFFSFNNRGHDVISYLTKEMVGGHAKQKSGTAYEDVQDSYYDIKAAIDVMLEQGYQEIYLQGHSLGCTKIVYTYNKLKRKSEMKYLNSIKAIMLLSLIDIPRAQVINLGSKYDYMLEYAIDKEKNGKQDMLMPRESFIHPISVKSYLRYFRDNEKINFAQYSNKDYNYEELNNMTIPLFMRWGNVFEMIEQPAEELIQIVNTNITNNQKDINYIEGANHGYTDKEQQVAEEMLEFLKRI